MYCNLRLRDDDCTARFQWASAWCGWWCSKWSIKLKVCLKRFWGTWKIEKVQRWRLIWLTKKLAFVRFESLKYSKRNSKFKASNKNPSFHLSFTEKTRKFSCKYLKITWTFKGYRKFTQEIFIFFSPFAK